MTPTRQSPRAGALAGLVALVALTGCGGDLGDLAPVLDLVAELPVAEIHREVDEIDLGTPLAAEHVLWGWSWNEREPAPGGGETSYAWGVGGSSGLRFYLTTRRDLRLELRGRPGPADSQGPQVVTVKVEGEVVERVTLKPLEAGWITYSVSVPREALGTGWNVLTLAYRHSIEPRETGLSGDRRALAVAWDRIRVEPARSLEEPGPEATAAAADREGEPATLRLPLGTEVAYYAALPEGSVLAFDSLRATGVDARLLVGLQWEGEDAVDLRSLHGSDGHRTVALPGPTTGGKKHREDGVGLARLSLRAVPAGWLEAREATSDGAIEVVAPRVLAPPRSRTPEEEEEAAEPPVNRGGSASPHPHVLVYLIDTLRADRVGAYSPAAAERGLTPHIDRFARGAVVFEDALTQAPWTRPVVASVFTGRPPLAHGVTTLESRLPRRAVTLAEFLADLPGGGYRTAAWSANWHVVRKTGLAQGFQHFDFFPAGPGPFVVNRRLLTWLDRQLASDRAHPHEPRRPFFLYVHVIDPHAPYRPPPDLRRRFAPEVEDRDAGTNEYLKRIYGASGARRADLLAAIPPLYDAEVALADRGFGRLLAALAERGLRDDMLIVLLSDHGEEFDEHGDFGHGNNLYQESLRIPLIVDPPGREPGRRAGTALPMDVPATVLAALGVPRPPGMAGVDLLGDPRRRAGRPAFAHVDYQGRAGVSVVLGEWKLVEPLTVRFGRGPELFHLRRDPEERENLAESRPVRTGYLQTLVRRHRLETEEGAEAGERMELDPEIREGLEALGYL